MKSIEEIHKFGRFSEILESSKQNINDAICWSWSSISGKVINNKINIINNFFFVLLFYLELA